MPNTSITVSSSPSSGKSLLSSRISSRTWSWSSRPISSLVAHLMYWPVLSANYSSYVFLGFFFLCFRWIVHDFLAYHRSCLACFHHPRFRWCRSLWSHCSHWVSHVFINLFWLFDVNTTLYSVFLCEILTAVFFLVEGLLVLVVEIIKPYGDHCHFVKYTQILVILGIKFWRTITFVLSISIYPIVVVYLLHHYDGLLALWVE